MSAGRTFIVRLRIQNFKSIKACDAKLGPLAILVGPNGSGKSNFLDALRLTADALNTTLDQALRDRGGVNEVRRRSGGHPSHFAIRIDLQIGSAIGHYSFKIGATKGGGFQVTDEECRLLVPSAGDGGALTGVPTITWFRVRGGHASSSLSERLPAVAPDRLYLVAMSGTEPFRSVFQGLTAMGFYNLSPADLRQLQKPDQGELLRHDGSNLPSVLGHLEQHSPATLERIVDYLRVLSPGVQGVERIVIGPMETIEFRQQVPGQAVPWRFGAMNVSDGTLRGLGVLVALLQSNSRLPTLVGIEEPEVALHPAAVGVLIDAIREAAASTQVVVTSHSPELLDRPDLPHDAILAVTAESGLTTIGPVNEASREVLREGLYTPGELLRLNQLQPSADFVKASQTTQLKLFDS